MRKKLIGLLFLVMSVFVAVLFTGCNENNKNAEEKESGWAEIERIVTIPIDSDYSGPVYLSVNGCNSLVIIATIIFK